jgi:hypothetical protein
VPTPASSDLANWIASFFWPLINWQLRRVLRCFMSTTATEACHTGRPEAKFAHLLTVRITENTVPM